MRQELKKDNLVGRQVLQLDCDWRFQRGDVDASVPNKHLAAYMANKAGYARGAAKRGFDDSDWRRVNLPHDWSVEGPFDPSNHVNQGFLPRGIGWYRRHFQLDQADEGKRLKIRFDGVATHCTVWVNGHLMHRHFCGYTPFTIDITDVASFGEQLNVIAVRVDATEMEGWWYEGAGIYRHVWLMKLPPLHLAEDGVFVRTVRREGDRWETIVQTTVENESDQEAAVEIVNEVRSADGQVVARGVQACRVPARSRRCGETALCVDRPRLWSVEEPNLCSVHTSVREAVDAARRCSGRRLGDWAAGTAAATTTDRLCTRFGYRMIRFDPDRGFFLNDRPLKLLGTCNHQDHAGVGVAVPDSIHAFRIRRLKEMGANAYRCAHNPPAPELLDACDRLGMLVMDEARNFGSTPQHLEQLDAMVRRDRNHPSVILWSICNEEAIQGTPVGARIARAMQAAVKKLDPSRPVTAAVSGGILNDDCIADSVEVTGINYQLGTYDPYHAKHPTTPLYASETHCTYSTRGTYHTDAAQRVFSSYDSEAATWGSTARETWRAVSSRPFVAGLFAWTGFDYRGEPTPYEWPCVSTHWGIMDTCGFAKDAFWLHKALFTRGGEPFIHLLPHWNWTGMEGSAIRVAAYTNCDEVELWRDDESLGRRRVDPIEMAEWSVVYRPGRLRAVGYREGKEAARADVETTGEPVKLGLEVHPSAQAMLMKASVTPSPRTRGEGRVRQQGLRDRPLTPALSPGYRGEGKIPADGSFAVPITAFAMDSSGRRVPTAEPFVRFSIDGPGTIIGVGNGDPNCQEPDKASGRSLFRGLAQVIVQTTTTPGRITLRAEAPGLEAATLELDSVAVPLPPSVPPARVRYFVRDWRMSPIGEDRPDPNQVIAEQDMNSWERIDPSAGPQRAWDSALSASGATGGRYALYRANITPPRAMVARGGCIVFRGLAGVAEVFVDGVATATKSDPAEAELRIRLDPMQPPLNVSVVVRAESAPAGLVDAVELEIAGM